MAGIDLVVLPQQSYDFGVVANGQSPGEMSFQVGGEVNASQYREGTLEVLVKSAALPSTGAALNIYVLTIGRVQGESTPYTNETPIATVTLTSSVTNPKLHTGALSANFGAMVIVVIEATSDGSSTGDFNCEIQINLSLKN